MRKLSVSFITVIMLLFCSMTFAFAETVLLEYDGGIHEYNGALYALVVNNQVIETPLEPIIFNDRALVPVREIFEEVGATVNYIGETQTVEIFYNSDYIRMSINDNIAYINGEKTNIPDNVVPKLISKLGGETKTMVPVRFISETIGLDVEFDSEDGAILISDGYTMYDEEQSPTVDEIVNSQQSDIQTDTSVTPYVCDVSYEITDDTNVRIIVTTDSDISGYSDFTLSSPERVILDLTNAKLNVTADSISVNSSGVTSIRLGDNDERARVVVDVTNFQSYYIEELASNMLAINVTTKETVSPTAAPSNATEQGGNVSVTPDSSKLIVLDAGHGGTDPGAIGYIDGEAILEKDLTLEITYKVKEILEEAGYTVSMTRTGDTLPSLTERPAQANEENAAVFVSIHINSVENAPEANGTEVYYATENNGDEYGTTSEKLATNILNRMLYYMGSTNRGVKTAEHAVTRRCEMPAALVEVGFITNAEEVYNMTTEEYQYKAAQGIAEGIMITLKDITVPN